MALGLFRMVATLARDMVIANTCSSAALLGVLCLGGFIIPKGNLNYHCSLDVFLYPSLLVSSHFSYD